MKYLSFQEAKSFVQKLGLKSYVEWFAYCKSGKKPEFIPIYPMRVYTKQWQGMGDWLGTGRIANQNKVYRSFENAKRFVQSLGLKSGPEWNEYCKSGKKPEDIPSGPHTVYEKDWKDWGDWLGTGYVAVAKRGYRSFRDAKNFVQSLGLKSEKEWKIYCKSREKPKDIPNSPAHVYKKDWKGIGDWLGTGYVALYNRSYRNFEYSRKFVRSLRLENREKWQEYCNTGAKPIDIPNKPSHVYKKDWNGWGDWLGTGRIATQNRVYRSFVDARQFVQSLGLKNREEWSDYCKSGNKPEDIPSLPWQVYEDEWIGYSDWFGNEVVYWSVTNIKLLLKGLIDSNVIYGWTEAVLYSFLLRKGLLNLVHGNPHRQFFKNLFSALKGSDGRNQIEEYVKSDSKIPPDLSNFSQADTDNLEEIQLASQSELSTVIEDTDPFDYEKIEPIKQILRHTDILESTNIDEEAMQFYVNYSLSEIWKAAFRNEKKTLQKIKEEGHNGNKYHDMIIDIFLNDYEESHAIKSKLPGSYSLSYLPKLMQLYVANKIKSLPYFGNFSGTGAGKTLSAIIASRIIDSKLTVIVCPNDVVDQWKIGISETFPDSKIVTGKDAFHIQYTGKMYQYAVLNYDKFSQDDSPNLILKLSKQKIDFVILDEIHFTKIRDEEMKSQRRKNLDGLLTAIKKKNSKSKILGLSATPVVNNLMEGRSLLELITGKIYDDIATKATIPNAVTLYEKLSTISIRELPDYNVKINTNFIEVEAQRPKEITVKQLKRNPLEIEKFLTDARIPEIIKSIEGQTIIYTEYVEEIIEKLSDAVNQEGYSFALYTGDDKSGLSRFLDKKIQVLIASRPISVGVDRLQHICNRLIINTLPWTNAQYQQLLGRLVRMGQIKDVVHIYVIKANIAGYPYDELKWKRIQFKRTLADCAVDGRLPERNLVTPQQAAMEAVKWLERLERGEISTVVRRDLNVELSPVEIKKRVIKYGDFTKLNRKINTENSDTTHHRMLKEPKEWEEYHRQYREARKTWAIIPYEEIIKRIKQLSPRLLIGDFGCGEAKILEAFGTERVESFDHVAINNKVTACDMKSVPLPEEAIDIAVFSLSLMGRNWPDYVTEAKRCLATGGYLLIAETTKSINGRLAGIRDIIKKQGFEIYVDEVRGEFTIIEAREL